MMFSKISILLGLASSTAVTVDAAKVSGWLYGKWFVQHVVLSCHAISQFSYVASLILKPRPSFFPNIILHTDNLCIGNCEGTSGPTSCTPDGSNAFYTPAVHTGECLLFDVGLLYCSLILILFCYIMLIICLVLTWHLLLMFLYKTVLCCVWAQYHVWGK